MKKKRKLKKKVVVFIVLFIILIISILGVILLKTLSPKETSTRKVLDEIPGYGYTLEDNQPKIYKDLFKELTTELSKETIDEEKYASLISQMFAIDFYNLDNKISKNDVGGTQFIYEKSKENFVLKASDTVYKYIEQNIYGDRKQTLPVVKSAETKDIKKDQYKFQDIKDDKTYVVTINLEYKEDLGYPEELEIKLLHNGKKLEIYEMK